ncbi:hypothetical protein CRM22_003437 [Opisthorchis felineus]|uniref:Uncharacterized protein n=1 Tax=Opisthorchis felineus TaxID=147828 RepID=A0A4S2M159_OPIFE|nr:hypothetical protein CRM22_003437 [Opisthorchis felineus]
MAFCMPTQLARASVTYVHPLKELERSLRISALSQDDRRLWEADCNAEPSLVRRIQKIVTLWTRMKPIQVGRGKAELVKKVESKLFEASPQRLAYDLVPSIPES